MLSAIIISVLASIGLLAGIGLTLINLPGNFFILFVAFGYAVYDDFTTMTVSTLLIVLGMFLAGELAEFIAGALGAKRQKASTRAMAAAVLGAVGGGVLGTGVLPIVGSIIGAVLGAFAASYIAEYSKAGDADRARQVGISVMKGQAL
ncbi:MAG: DUF456 family protein, partial [Negativicutes bacterium]|nr:DUF456 family protein [Negativicutes bacterium]